MVDKVIDAERHCDNKPSFFGKNARGRFQERLRSSQVFKHFAHHNCIYLHIMMIP